LTDLISHINRTDICFSGKGATPDRATNGHQICQLSGPDGTQLWVTLDFKPVGTITLSHGSGSITPYNLGDFGVSRDQIRVYSSLPDAGTFQQILVGGAFS
jgi:hypothetical protein